MLCFLVFMLLFSPVYADNLSNALKQVDQAKPPVLPEVSVKQQNQTMQESMKLMNRANNAHFTQSNPIMPDTDQLLDLTSINTAPVNIDDLANQGQQLLNRTQQDKRYSNRIFIFISSSMPKRTVLNYLKATQLVDAALVLRGLVNNSMIDTKLYISHLLGDKPLPSDEPEPTLLIDPTLFDRFKVTQVPSIIVTEGDIQSCNQKPCDMPVYHSVEGDVTLSWALSLIKRQIASNELTDRLKPVIKKLQGSL